ncbi:MAG: radical SAM protein [Nitrospinae bacterium]|nr:radical SAM protein [Nitrospinota bacterium]
MKVGVMELLQERPAGNWSYRLYHAQMSKQFVSITPQAIAVWCRQAGHQVHYVTYYGQADPKSLLPNDLDVVFIGTYTPYCGLAYALAKLYRREKTLTVIGGPHAKSFSEDCLRYFDLVVKECDRTLVEDILKGRFESPAVITSGKPLTEIPSVEERMPDIIRASFSRGKPARMSVIHLLSSVGCPYTCDFCLDWDNSYIPLSGDALKNDLAFLSKNYPKVLVWFADPNFGINFDDTLSVLEQTPEGRRNPYMIESSLSVLRESRLQRLKDTNCIYVAPGVESWTEYSNKAGVGKKSGRDKLEQVIKHFKLLGEYIPGLQANFIFGTDTDRGDEPVELTREFIRSLPEVWATVNMPIPIGGTPLYDSYDSEGRILKTMPLSFYFKLSYLTVTMKNYSSVEFYDRLISLNQELSSPRMMMRRLATRTPLATRLFHNARALAVRKDIEDMQTVRGLLIADSGFRAFFEGRTQELPEFFHTLYEKNLGAYAELIPRKERLPVFPEPEKVSKNVLPVLPISPGGVKVESSPR